MLSVASMNNQPFVNNTSAQNRMAGVSGSEHGRIPTKQPQSQEGNWGCQWWKLSKWPGSGKREVNY